MRTARLLLIASSLVFGQSICLGPGCPTNDPKCVVFTWKPDVTYDVGSQVEYGNNCALHGVGDYISIASSNKGHDPRFGSLYWHSSCSICGADEVTMLLGEYEKLRDKCENPTGVRGVK